MAFQLDTAFQLDFVFQLDTAFLVSSVLVGILYGGYRNEFARPIPTHETNILQAFQSSCL